MKTKFSAILFFVLLVVACQTKNKESLVGKWAITSIIPIDTAASQSAIEIAAIGLLNNMTNGAIIEYYERGDYEIKRDTISLEKGKYTISENSITHIKADGSIEKNSLIFKNNSELEIKSSSMTLSLKKN
ncbi:MAG: hypothetical protein K8R85_15700 [Bacteroidetes bacterium]|nr:hypothetical protein [Bacteroidota bacterium]